MKCESFSRKFKRERRTSRYEIQRERMRSTELQSFGSKSRFGSRRRTTLAQSEIIKCTYYGGRFRLVCFVYSSNFRFGLIWIGKLRTE